jgi:hypothetical protein
MTVSIPTSRLHGKPRQNRRWPLLLLAVLLALPLFLTAWGMFKLGAGPAEAWRTLRSRPTMEMVRYAEFRLIGHPELEAVLLPVLNVVRHQLEREPATSIAEHGKGQRSDGLPVPTFDALGLPLEAQPSARQTPSPVPDRLLGSYAEIQAAMADARPGEVLEIAPGNYTIERTLFTGRPGTPGRPITLRARQPGTVELQVKATQGFVVNQPHWVFENLDLRGTCASPSECEHAFHVVGAAVGTVIRNNSLADFNAHIKINGEDGRWPDSGLLQFNSLSNSGARRVERPVAPVDLVAASRWRLVDNLVKAFVKDGGNGISYGMFMKGGGDHGVIERNLVICTPSGISQRGLRVGISVGGGGTDSGSCRDGRCEAEHWDAVVANNVVAHCNDVGIDVNHSQRTLVAFNTLVNTLGVLVREKPSSATVQGNLLEGSIRIRNGGELRQDHNLIVSRMGDMLARPDALDLRWLELPGMLPVHPMVKDDFCAIARPAANPPGATLSGRCREVQVPSKP